MSSAHTWSSYIRVWYAQNSSHNLDKLIQYFDHNSHEDISKDCFADQREYPCLYIIEIHGLAMYRISKRYSHRRNLQDTEGVQREKRKSCLRYLIKLTDCSMTSCQDQRRERSSPKH